MYEKQWDFNRIMKRMYNQVEYNIEPYKNILNKIDEIKLDTVSDDYLKGMVKRIKNQVLGGESIDDLLVEAYALVREASRRVLGLYPFDVQVIAGIALHEGKIVEMKTGEGKTLAAVMPAYLNALTEKGVHILTFSDYLAGRDANWMGPLYEFLGITVGYVKEGMENMERQKAYACHITYVTAKEAGFDYLRDFLCRDKGAVIQRQFNAAIIDEADSILIDEARIPLVIAGKAPQQLIEPTYFSDMVKKLESCEDYEVDQYNSNVYLTDRGLNRAEKIIGCDNLYELHNIETLIQVNCALHAEVLLKRDIDYIVRDGKIEIIDSFTGRIAKNRHWPDNLHTAVEAKEGLKSKEKGRIMGSIALQHFVSLYPKLSGMTGTAEAAAAELREYYCMDVVVIPTNKPCMRKDYSDRIFTNIEGKNQAIVNDIVSVHGTGQPILVGTRSVEESEKLASELEKAGIQCRVLNARNDRMEAEIIAAAGEADAVTVSTNMAGRGVDIKLGGSEEEQRDRVVALGGLYVVGTSHNESRRIDEQLRGRAGRQGDPGESRFFSSLEDDFIRNNDFIKIPAEIIIQQRSDKETEDASAGKWILKAQRMIEGYHSDIRMQLWRYTFILEQQRRIIHKQRQDILMDIICLKLLQDRAPQRYAAFRERVGTKALKKAEKQLTLYYMNKCWADYLDYISYIRESIHLVVIGNKNPLDEYNKIAVEAFEMMQEKMQDEIVEAFHTVEITEDGIDLEKEGLWDTSATWTYLLNDNPDQFSNLPFLIKTVSIAINGPLFSLHKLFKNILTKAIGIKWRT